LPYQHQRPLYEPPGALRILETLDRKTRDSLRRDLIRDQADRDAISFRLMPYRDRNGQDSAEIIDFLTTYPGARRRVVSGLAGG
jgi:hypothetical protein